MPGSRKPIASTSSHVMAALSRQANMIVTYCPGRRCGGPLRLDLVWVLPSAVGAAAPSAVVAAMPPAPSGPPDQATQDFLRAHGLAPSQTK